MQTLAVFPGTFDPLTLGHLDIIKRASKIFDKVIIAVAKSPSKHTLFDLDTRVLLCRESTKDLSNVSVTGFSGMLVDFLKEKNANILVRGVRTVADYDYETQHIAGDEGHPHLRPRQLAPRPLECAPLRLRREPFL